MRIIFINLLIFIFLSSCEKKCELKPIPKNIFDIEKIKSESITLESGRNLDILNFKDKYDSYTENSYNGLLKYEECGHHKSYTYNFRNETIQVCLDKNDKEIFELSLIGWFNKFNDIRFIKENELLLNKEYIFEREKDCDSTKSQIKRIVLSGYFIKSIITIDNKEWKIK
jgi:hypothetical protein